MRVNQEWFYRGLACLALAVFAFGLYTDNSDLGAGGFIAAAVLGLMAHLASKPDRSKLKR